jgi:import inner membrane translocase subunit TIM17
MLMKKRAPVLGGSFALWAGLFASTECLLIHLRNKEDFMNPIAAGFFTGGLLAARG